MRKLLTAVFMLLICQLINAQGGRLNVKGGGNLFILNASNDKTKDFSHARAGFILGAGYEIGINKNFTIQPELNITYQSAREDYHGSNIKLSYTQFPVMFRYHPTNVPVAIYAGPQVAFLNTAKRKPDNGSQVGIRGDLNQTDFGIAFGVARVPITKGLTVDARVYKGVMKVFKSEYDGGLDTRPTLITLTVGYIFGKMK